jgi:hypothetical protein
MSEETQVTPDQTAETVAAPAVEEPKVHPAWDKMLAELPEVLHGKIAPYLIENDKNVQAQLEKFSPYKDYVESGVAADYVSGAVSLAQRIEQDPVEVYKSLQEYLKSEGLLTEEAKQAAKDIMEGESGEEFDDLFGDSVPAALRKELEDLRAKTSEIEAYKNDQEFQKAVAEAESELENGINELKQTYPGLTPAHETAIYNLMNAALGAGNEISVAEAAKQLQEMIGAFAPAQSGEAAPTVVGSAGGAGIVAPNVTVPKDDKGKKEMLAAMFEERRKQNLL